MSETVDETAETVAAAEADLVRALAEAMPDHAAEMVAESISYLIHACVTRRQALSEAESRGKQMGREEAAKRPEPYFVQKPDSGWRAVESFGDEERRKLRPVAETLAMLDGNAFFGMPKGDDKDWWADQYLPQAAALYEWNGGDKGWAGEASFAKPFVTTVRPPLTGRQREAIVAIDAAGSHGAPKNQLRADGYSLQIMWALFRKGLALDAYTGGEWRWFLTSDGIRIAAAIRSGDRT